MATQSDVDCSRRIVIVGGGFAGLSIAARLAQAGLPVTLLEATELGFDASTRNQGWLHSGAWFASTQLQMARCCYESLQQTLQFCPDCLEPQHDGMLYLNSKPETLVAEWTLAWDKAGIPYEEVPVDRIDHLLPAFDRLAVQHAFLLPDRSIRVDILLEQLASTATNHGVEIRTHAPVTGLLIADGCVHGVRLGDGEEIPAQVVVLATGAYGTALWSEICDQAAGAGSQQEFTRVILKTQLVALQPEVGRVPFCVVDAEGFNHLPHDRTSVFGLNRWPVVSTMEDRNPSEEETERIWRQIHRFYPDLNREDYDAVEWAGTTVQAMHAEQIEPGSVPLPTVIDHGRQSPPIANLVSVYPGRATLWAHLAEDACSAILERCRSSTQQTVARPPWSL